MKYLFITLATVWGFFWGVVYSTEAKAQTIIVQPDGTIVTCIMNGTLIQCF